MRCHFIILLAVSSNLVRAGPLRHRAVLPQLNDPPPFVNQTAIPSPTTSETATSTSSVVSIAFSDDASFDGTPLSRIPTNANGQQDQLPNQKNAGQHSPGGVAISPEGGSSNEGVSSVAALGSDTVPSIFPSQASEATSRASATFGMPASSLFTVTVDGFTANTGKPTQDPQSQATVSTTPSAIDQSFMQISTTMSSTTQLGKTHVTESVLPPFSDVQAKLSQTMSTSIAAHTSTGTNKVSTQVQGAQITGSSTTETAATTATPATVGQVPTQSSNAQFAMASSTTVSNIASGQTNERLINTAKTPTIFSTAPSQVNSRMSNAQLTISSSAPLTSSPINKISSTLLGDANSPLSGPSVTSASQVNRISGATNAYPSTYGGNVAMAKDYNDIFRSLSPGSRCDPNNVDQASACVVGQPAQCEINGAYTLHSCDQGESCYAMPLPDGQTGVQIGCQKPSIYYKAVASEGVPTSSPSDNVQTAQNAADSSPEFDTLQGPEAAPTSTINNRDFTSSTSLAATVPIAQADTVPSSAAPPSKVTTNGDPTFAGFSSTIASVQNIQETQLSSVEAFTLPNAQNDQPAPADEGQQASQPSLSPLASTPSSTPEASSGVVLNFPGADVFSNNPSEEKQAQPTNDPASSPTKLSAFEKEAVPLGPLPETQASAVPSAQKVKPTALADTVPSSNPLPPASPTTNADIPGITIAPLVGGSNPNTPVTITVTYTTTVHDQK
ncbi:MAG: hypothetical protein Q9163_000061 [Psora crenata]